MTLQLSQFAQSLSEMGERSRHPEASDREIFLGVAAHHIPRELMTRAYMWGPETDGQSL